MTTTDSSGAHNVFVTLGASNHSVETRADHDYYATDPRAMELLLEHERFSENVWECACGEGHLSRVLTEHGYRVSSTDLIDRGYGMSGVDFLTYTDSVDADIVTNPPYKYAKEFAEHAVELVTDGHKVAMFLRLSFLEGKSRRELFDRYPPKHIYVSSGRLLCAKNGDFDSGGGGAVAHAWFVWEKGFQGEPTVRWIN